MTTDGFPVRPLDTGRQGALTNPLRPAAPIAQFGPLRYRIRVRGMATKLRTGYHR